MSKNQSWLPTEKNIEDYSLLKDMLHAQRQEFYLLSKKKSDGQLNKMKIKIVNRVIEPLNELLKNESSHKFLDILNENDMPMLGREIHRRFGVHSGTPPLCFQ